MLAVYRVLVVLVALIVTDPAQVPAAPEEASQQELRTDREEGHESPCRGCSPECAFCLCCPVRAAATPWRSLSSVENAIGERLTLPPERPAPRSDGARIFHPPRA